MDMISFVGVELLEERRDELLVALKEELAVGISTALLLLASATSGSTSSAIIRLIGVSAERKGNYLREDFSERS